MPVVRCAVCREYVPRDSVYYSSRLTRVCSEECFSGAHEKRVKRERARQSAPKPRKENRLDLALRRKIRARDGNVCRWCGRQGQQVHHILYRSQGGPDHESNLILLCEEHHSMVHSNKRHWQPVLLALIWRGYCHGQWLTVPEMERSLIRSGTLSRLAA